MSDTSEKLFEYLRGILYASSKTELNLEELEDDYVMLGKGLVYFAQCVSQFNELATALAKGDLSAPPPPPENELVAPLKSLQASLKHLTWQSKQVAVGDYKQRVDFMGEFADAFNTMVEQLADRQHKLENEIELSMKRATALEQGNKLLSNVTKHIPQQIFVLSRITHEILLKNNMANRELRKDNSYLDKVREQLPKDRNREPSYSVKISITTGTGERYLSVTSYHIEWEKSSAVALVINDISAEKKQMMELESHAYHDEMTNLYNRFYGMLALNKLVEKRRKFSLIFVDMDNLKFINDRYGHNNGDKYIMSVAYNLAAITEDATACRIGGDEFMVLVPGKCYEEAIDCMVEVQNAISNDEYLKDKDFTYSISYGIVSVGEDNNLQSSGILSLADERMYEHKRARKMERKSAAQTSDE